MSPQLAWVAFVGIGIILLLALAVLLTRSQIRERRAYGPADESGEPMRLPMAPFQKQALWSLGIGVAISLAIVIVFLVHGSISLADAPGTRHFITGLFLIGLASYAWLLFRTRGRYGSKLDEREQAILARAANVQVVAMIVALVIWNIVLTEVYRDEGALPLEYPNLIFFSVFIINMLANACGILLGYWRR